MLSLGETCLQALYLQVFTPRPLEPTPLARFTGFDISELCTTGNLDGDAVYNESQPENVRSARMRHLAVSVIVPQSALVGFGKPTATKIDRSVANFRYLHYFQECPDQR